MEPLHATRSRSFVVPAAVISSIAGLGVFYGALYLLAPESGAVGATVEHLGIARTALTMFLVMSGLLLVVFVAPPNRFFAVIEPETDDNRPALLAVALALGFFLVVELPFGRTLFDLRPVPAMVIGLVAAFTVAWLLLVRVVWRTRLLDRFLAA